MRFAGSCLAACRARITALESVRHARRCTENAEQSEVTALDGLENLRRKDASAEWMSTYIKTARRRTCYTAFTGCMVEKL